MKNRHQTITQKTIYFLFIPVLLLLLIHFCNYQIFQPTSSTAKDVVIIESSVVKLHAEQLYQKHNPILFGVSKEHIISTTELKNNHIISIKNKKYEHYYDSYSKLLHITL